MIYLHKLLPLIVSPLGLLLILMLLSVFLRRIWPAYLALASMLAFSFPITSHLIWSSLESEYPYRHIDEVGQHDAVVVLGGMFRVFASNDGYDGDWGESSDRFFAGINLINSGKADRLIFTRGQKPWFDTPPEGEMLRMKAVNMGLSESQVLLTGIAANTADEAIQVKLLMDREGFKSILLVTSSFHMPRSKALFDRAGIDSEPYPADFREYGYNVNWLDFIPSAQAFKETSDGIREYLGRIYYRLRFDE